MSTLTQAPEIPREILERAGKFVDIDTSQWPTVRFVIKPEWFTREDFEAYLDAFGILLMRAPSCSLRLLFDLTGASPMVDPRFVLWQSRFSTDMKPQYEVKIERTAVVLANRVLRGLVNSYFERTPATRPKKFFATRAEAEQGLRTGW